MEGIKEGPEGKGGKRKSRGKQGKIASTRSQ